MLKDPQKIYNEYKRRLVKIDKSPVDSTVTSLEKQRRKLEKGISLLIDSYTQQYITKDEFEPRIKVVREKLINIQEEEKKLREKKNLAREIEVVISNLENFINRIITNLDDLDWIGRRDIIRKVIKRIEMSDEEINIVYKINRPTVRENYTSAQHCCNGTC